MYFEFKTTSVSLCSSYCTSQKVKKTRSIVCQHLYIIFYPITEFFTTGITILYICGIFVLCSILVKKYFSVATWYKYSPLANKSWGTPFSLFFVWCFPSLSPPVSSFRGALYHSVQCFFLSFFHKKPKGSVYSLFSRRSKTFKLTIFLR